MEFGSSFSTIVGDNEFRFPYLHIYYITKSRNNQLVTAYFTVVTCSLIHICKRTQPLESAYMFVQNDLDNHTENIEGIQLYRLT